ncbi:MAG: hypothetical protein FWD78_10985 [Treponema sp.]|nr:hypothetical protein [Treponema sp.]
MNVMSADRPLFLFFLLLFFLALTPVFSGDNSAPAVQNAGSELFSAELGDSSVSVDVSGYWKGTLSAGWGIALTPFGSTALAGDTPFFMQETDLTLSVWIRDRWFVEGSFLDNYNLNTFRAGYQGGPADFVQYAGIGNTGLDFPSFPYLDLGESTPSSFGFYGRFGTPDLSVHTLIRYDSGAREEKIFTQGRERTYSYADVTSPIRGISFILPDFGLSAVPVVYIEDPSGKITDNRGRRWRLAESGEYAASGLDGIITMTLGTYTGGAAEPDGMIAASYTAGNDPKPWVSSLGSYTDGSGFLGKVQQYFDSSGRDIDLGKYPQAGGGYPAASGVPSAGNGPSEVYIDGMPALIIFEKGTFSPFEQQNLYSIAYDGSDNTASLVKMSTGTVVSGYEFIPDDDNTGAALRLIRGNLDNKRDEKERWPLAAGTGNGTSDENIFPEIYLPGKKVFTGDLGIRIANYSAADSFYIGTDIIPGSVRVLRDGIPDPDFNYNPGSGTVSLRYPPFYNETIRISYLRQSQDSRSGSIAAGAGLLWKAADHLNTKIGLGLRWNLSGAAYSEQGISSPGTVGLGAQADWDYSNFTAGLAAGLGYEQPDTSGLYRAAGMEGNDIVMNLPPADSFISAAAAGYDIQSRANLVYRNYREVSVFGTSSLGNIESNAPVIAGMNGPYPAMDTAFTSSGSIQILAAEFELDSQNSWTGFEVPLGPDGSLLERAAQIEIPYRFFNISGNAEKLNIVFQAGTLTGKDGIAAENPDLVIDRSLYPNPSLPAPGQLPSYQGNRTVTINLTDEDRVKLNNAQYIRIIIWAPLDTAETITGRFILAPPVIKGAGFRVVIANGNKIYPANDSLTGTNNAAVMETVDMGKEKLRDKYGQVIGKLNPDNKINRILEIAWDNMDSGAGAGADQRLSNLPLANYGSISFFIRRPKAGGNQQTAGGQAPDDADQEALDQGSLRFLLGQGPQSFNNPGETIIDANIPLKAFDIAGVSAGQWAKVKLQYQGSGREIYLDDISVSGYPGACVSGHADLNQTNSVWLAFLVMPGAVPLPDGNTAADEVILENPIPAYRLNASGSVNWSRPGTLVTAGDINILSDLSLSAAAEYGAGGNPFEQGTGAAGINGRTGAEFSLLGMRVTGNYSYSFQHENYNWRAGHSLSGSWKYFTFSESFNLDTSNPAFGHSVSAALTAPFRLYLAGNLSWMDLRFEKNWQAGIDWSSGSQFAIPSTASQPALLPALPIDLSFNVSASWTENAANINGAGNYAAAWYYSLEPLMPDPGNNAVKRNGRSGLTFSLKTSPLGFRLYTEASSAFTKADKSAASGTLIRIEFPLTIGAWRLLFRQDREFRRSLFYGSRDFSDDLGLYAAALNNYLPLMFCAPFYSLFDSNIRQNMTDANAQLTGGASLNSGRFFDRTELTLQMPANYSFTALFIPARIALRLNRTQDQKMDVLRDTLSFGGTLNFSAINLFGSLGASPVFSFYSSDQFTHSLDAVITMHYGEKTGYRLQAAQDLSFRGFSGAELRLNNSLTIGSSGYYNDQNRITDTAGLAWTRPMEKTILGIFYSSVMAAAEKQDSWPTLSELGRTAYDLLCRENVDFIYEYIPGLTSAQSRFTLSAGHESIVRIFGRLNLSVYAKINISEDFGSRILTLLGTVGTSLTITF